MSEGEVDKPSDEHTTAQGVASVASPASKVDRLQRWLTLGANIGVLLGLFLVIIQINQNTELARSAYKSEGNVLSNNVWSQMIGDRIGDTIEKSNG